MRTTDGGQSWALEPQRATPPSLQDVVHLDAETAIAVGSAGVILHRTVNGGDPGPDPEPEPSEGSQDIVATVPEDAGGGPGGRVAGAECGSR